VIRDVIASRSHLKRLARALGFGSRPGDPRLFLLDLLPRDSVGAEIGVHVGDFSEVILDVVRPRTLHLIDPWRHEPGGDYAEALYGGRAQEGQAEMDRRHARVLTRFAPEIRRGAVVVHRGPSAEALAGFADGSLDWVYIDGNHRYEFVAADLAMALAKTQPGGLVAGDDYGDEGWWGGGVSRAVDEVVAAGAAQLVRIERAQFLLRNQPSASSVALPRSPFTIAAESGPRRPR